MKKKKNVGPRPRRSGSLDRGWQLRRVVVLPYLMAPATARVGRGARGTKPKVHKRKSSLSSSCCHSRQRSGAGACIASMATQPGAAAAPRRRSRGPLARLAAMETGQCRPPRGTAALQEMAPTAFRALNRDGLLDVLKKLDECTVPSASVRGELERLARLCDAADSETDSRQLIIALGGTGALLRLLAASPAEAQGGSQARASARVLSGTRNDVLFLLRELCFTTEGFSEMLSRNSYVILRCFELMVRPQRLHGDSLVCRRPAHDAHKSCFPPTQGSSLTFENAVGLAEELLAVSDRTLSLRKVANLPELVRGMSREELALFCRALALMVFEQEARPQTNPARARQVRCVSPLEGSWRMHSVLCFLRRA